EAGRHLLHAKMTIPAKPGPLVLVYPKWLPGEHGPTGPNVDIVGLSFTAAGKTLPWTRDPADMYQYRLEVPAGAAVVEATLDFAIMTGTGGFTSGGSSTDNLAIVSWNQVILYPAGPNGDDIQFSPSLMLPDGWKSATQLESTGSGTDITYKPVSLTMLVDSPVLAGRFFRTIPLTDPADRHPVRLNIAADSAAALDAKPEVLDRFKRLVAEETTLFGARHYRKYDFLMALSDHIAHFGLEHHESSDNRLPERFLVDPDIFLIHGDLLAHEMTHSWNGKYRRPRGLQANDYRQPIDSSMLWVYEGLTNYLGDTLAARSGLWTEEQARDHLAWDVANLSAQPGRRWRPLVDTGTAAQLLYGASDAWQWDRRSVDFYEEGTLLWHEVDSILRERTGGKKSLDDFCRLFHGGADGPPEVKWYDADEVYRTLEGIASYTWKAFFEERVYGLRKEPPLGWLERGGWRLAYSDEKPALLKAREEVDDIADERHSLGFLLRKDAVVVDVFGGSPAAKAGLAPSMTLIAVNGRRYDRKVLETALGDAKSGRGPIEILAENAEFFHTFKVDWSGGERYPRLERIEGKPDGLSEVLKPRAGR
ncbi:MAG TPA: M61 family peptidase, partial [Candidatus Polarisedimenticolia bacterium]|nr:M61 family peptidase [Candidatus Polarisedimenticolia bacterium]